MKEQIGFIRIDGSKHNKMYLRCLVHALNICVNSVFFGDNRKTEFYRNEILSFLIIQSKKANMKKFLIVALAANMLFSCAKLTGNSNETDDPQNSEYSEHTIFGEWKLIERLVDPGDGSGEYVPVQSEKKLIFFENGTVTSNGSLCLSGDLTDNGDQGEFSLGDSLIHPQSCPQTEVRFIWNQELLEVEYVSIETIKEKFLKED